MQTHMAQNGQVVMNMVKLRSHHKQNIHIKQKATGLNQIQNITIKWAVCKVVKVLLGNFKHQVTKGMPLSLFNTQTHKMRFGMNMLEMRHNLS